MGLYIACVRTRIWTWPKHTTPNKKTIMAQAVPHVTLARLIKCQHIFIDWFLFMTVKRQLTCSGCKSVCHHGLGWHASHPAFAEWGVSSLERRDLATSRSEAASQFDCTEKQSVTRSRDVKWLAGYTVCTAGEILPWALLLITAASLITCAGLQGIRTWDLQTVRTEDLHWQRSPVKSLTGNRLCFLQNPVTEEINNHQLNIFLAISTYDAKVSNLQHLIREFTADMDPVWNNVTRYWWYSRNKQQRVRRQIAAPASQASSAHTFSRWEGREGKYSAHSNRIAVEMWRVVEVIQLKLALQISAKAALSARNTSPPFPSQTPGRPSLPPWDKHDNMNH